MRLRISIEMPNFEMPNLDFTSKEISIQSTIVPVRKSLVQWLTESRFGISKFGSPIEIRSLMYVGIGCILNLLILFDFFDQRTPSLQVRSYRSDHTHVVSR